jgi:hypothetical protein
MLQETSALAAGHEASCNTPAWQAAFAMWQGVQDDKQASLASELGPPVKQHYSTGRVHLSCSD